MHIQFLGDDGTIENCHGNFMTIDISKKRLIPLLHTGDLILGSSNNHFHYIISYSKHYLPRKVISAGILCDVLCDAVCSQLDDKEFSILIVDDRNYELAHCFVDDK